jgi:ABC-2 type transport system ATP-binding protein
MNSSGEEYRTRATRSEGNAIAVRDLDVRRGGRRVLRGISIDVRRGLVTGLLGPSGSGKTTLMRAIVGVQIVAGGEVTVLGRPAGTPALRHQVAYVTQAPSVYADLTVRENLQYFASVLGAPSARIDETIAATGLTEQTGQVVRTVSGGEHSRTSLAVALLGDPDLLVLDEPTVGLDPVLRTELWRQFHALAAEGKTVLVSTHVMDEAERCDELILMREGRIVASGPPHRLLEETQTGTLEEAFLAFAEARP